MKSPASRGRPRLTQDDLVARQNEISRVALMLFLSEGFESVSMRRIAREIGLTPMALYRYFPSKLDILSSIWGYVFNLAFDQVSAAVRSTTTPEVRLQAASEAYVNYWLCNVHHYHLVFMSSAVTKEAVRSFIGRGEVVAKYGVFVASIAEIQGQGGTMMTVKHASDGLVTHLHGIMHSLITMPGYSWTDSQKLVKQAVANAMDIK